MVHLWNLSPLESDDIQGVVVVVVEVCICHCQLRTKLVNSPPLPLPDHHTMTQRPTPSCHPLPSGNPVPLRAGAREAGGVSVLALEALVARRETDYQHKE